MSLPLQSKNIVLGVTASIAAYKSVDLVSRLRELGANVFVVATEAAREFVSELSLEVISGNRVFTRDSKHTSSNSLLADAGSSDSYIDHIHLAKIADLVLIAPASANSIAKLASAMSDDLIYDIILASKSPILLAPAMNTNMWTHPGVQKNLKIISEEYHYFVIPPAVGALACKTSGIGRLADLEKIVETVEKIFSTLKTMSKSSQEGHSSMRSQDLVDKNILISSGGTKEYIDPVRYISNDSSGEMGFALAQECLYRGANVIFVTTVDYTKDYIKSALLEHPNLLLLKVSSSEEMLKTMQDSFGDSVDAVIMAAAVADYSPAEYSSEKIKKDSSNLGTVTLELRENADIIKSLAVSKKDTQVIVGFSLESSNLLENARKKLNEKNLDMIIANAVDAINKKESEINIIYPKIDDSSQLEVIELPMQDKSLSANHILDHLGIILKAKHEKYSYISDRET